MNVLDKVKAIWNATIGGDQKSLYKSAKMIEDSTKPIMDMLPTIMQQKDLDRQSYYGALMTILYQNSGHFEDAGRISIKLLASSKQALMANNSLNLDLSHSAAFHSGAFCLAADYHRQLALPSDSMESLLTTAKILCEEATNICTKHDESTGEDSSRRVAAIAGTMSFISFTEGDFHYAKLLMESAETLNPMQAKKENSDTWPKPCNDFIPKEWNEFIECPDNYIQRIEFKPVKGPSL